MQSVNWYAAYTRPRHERAVVASLAQCGYETVYPSYSVASRWSDRVKRIESPLFPGYVFVRCDALLRLPVLKTPGLLYLVGDGIRPLPVPDAEVENLQRAMRSHARMQPVPHLNEGEQVYVGRGPLAGLSGFLLAWRNSLRVVISVELLARSVAVEVEAAWLEKPRPSAATH